MSPRPPAPISWSAEAQLLLASAVLLAACSSTTSGPVDARPSSDAALDAGLADAGLADAAPADGALDAAVQPDAAPLDASLCAVTEAYLRGCGGDLTCGARFPAWCALEDEAINSEAYRRAEGLCLTPANCDADRRRACEYGSYAATTPTAEQTALAAAYCATCEPASADCASRVGRYDPVAGPSAVTDIFIAVWELGDPLTRSIREGCTGSALDGGTAADASCATRFADCAGGLYIDRLPNCP